jgi:hypothetical protein
MKMNQDLGLSLVVGLVAVGVATVLSAAQRAVSFFCHRLGAAEVVAVVASVVTYVVLFGLILAAIFALRRRRATGRSARVADRGALRAALDELGVDWEADVDDLGTTHEAWTGKWYRRRGDRDDSVDLSTGRPAFARAVAAVVNAAPRLLLELDDQERQIAELEADPPAATVAPAAPWRHDTPPRGVRCLVTVRYPHTKRLRVASVSPDEDAVTWLSDGERLHDIVAWMPDPEVAADP